MSKQPRHPTKNAASVVSENLLDVRKTTRHTETEMDELRSLIYDLSDKRHDMTTISKAAKELAFSGLDADEILEYLPVAVALADEAITSVELTTQLVATAPELFCPAGAPGRRHNT